VLRHVGFFVFLVRNNHDHQWKGTAMITAYISPGARVPASADGERVLTVDELARQFRVSTKTVSRWRQRGLVSRRFLFDGRPRIGFLQSSVDRFVAENAEQVRRGAQFSQLTDEDRKQLVERARCLAQAGACPATVSRQIAQEMGRSEETVRYTLRHFNLAHPDLAIFPYNDGPLQTDTKRQIFQEYRRGESAEALARRFCQSRTHIYRIIKEMRTVRVMELPLDYIPNDQFAKVLRRQMLERKVLGPMPANEEAVKKVRLPAGLPPYLAGLYEVPLLTRAQEAHLFRKMNYLKYKAAKLRSQLDPSQPKSSLMDMIDEHYAEAVVTKNQILRANLRLVVSIAKRYIRPAENFFELVSDGNMSLMRAAEKFDFARGYKFSTYASWAIMKNFARTIPDEYRHRDRFRTSNAEMFSTVEDARTGQYEQESAQLQRQSQVQGILKGLDERERQIVTSRFGLGHGQQPLTLKQVGAAMGVTKERIRQIQCRAMGILRKAAEEGRIECDMAIARPASNPLPQLDPH
jgi:RNA polymerase primary sigma factor/RNA polymerase sigma factor